MGRKASVYPSNWGECGQERQASSEDSRLKVSGWEPRFEGRLSRGKNTHPKKCPGERQGESQALLKMVFDWTCLLRPSSSRPEMCRPLPPQDRLPEWKFRSPRAGEEMRLGFLKQVVNHPHPPWEPAVLGTC